MSEQKPPGPDRPKGQPKNPPEASEAVPQPPRPGPRVDTPIDQDGGAHGPTSPLSRAPGGKAWAASSGGQLSISIAVVISYLFGTPWEVALAMAAVLLAVVPALFVYLTPPEA